MRGWEDPRTYKWSVDIGLVISCVLSFWILRRNSCAAGQWTPNRWLELSLALCFVLLISGTRPSIHMDHQMDRRSFVWQSQPWTFLTTSRDIAFQCLVLFFATRKFSSFVSAYLHDCGYVDRTPLHLAGDFTVLRICRSTELWNPWHLQTCPPSPMHMGLACWCQSYICLRGDLNHRSNGCKSDFLNLNRIE